MKKLYTTACLLTTFTALFAQPAADRDTSYEMIVPPPTVVAAGTAQYLNMLLEANGEVMLAGGIYNYAGDYGGVLRMDPTGSFSNSWSGNFFGTVRAMAKTPDGKYYMVGQFTSYASVPRLGIVRIHPDGTLDEAFDAGPDAPPIQIFSVAAQADGRVLVGGYFADWAGSGRKGLVRLNTDGTVDESFSVGTGPNGNNSVECIHVLPDGKILVAGTFSSFNGGPEGLVRLLPNGAVDDSFNTSIDHDVLDLAVMADGRIVTAGKVRRLLPDGADDPTFQGQGTMDNVTCVEVYPDGKVLAGGVFTSYAGTPRQRIARLLANGTLDPAFDTAVGFDGMVLDIQLDAQGRIYVCHYSTTYKNEELLHYHTEFSVSNKLVIRLHGDGLPASVADLTMPALNVFPNPAHDQVTVHLPEQQLTSIQLFGADGRMVNTLAGALADRMVLPLGEVIPGVYLLEVRTAQGHRIVKQVVRD